MKNHAKLRGMTQTAILAAIIFVMAFTPVGYLKIGPVSITFIMLPVVIGSIVVSPSSGAVLGGIFGLTSFIQCFGMDAFGTTLLGINPVFTFIMCFIPRILAGWLPGLIYRALIKIDKTRIVSYMAASLSGALINTVLFVGTLVLFFGSSEYLRQFGDSIWAIISVLVTFNAAIEAGVCLVVGGALAKALDLTVNKKPQAEPED